MQDRAGYGMLLSPDYPYPPDASQNGRQEAIAAVRTFVDEVRSRFTALAEEGSDLAVMSAPLHVHLFLKSNSAAHEISAIMRSAQRYGLACYDPQTDTLTLPASAPLLESSDTVAGDR
jgi:hypothetical protein